MYLSMKLGICLQTQFLFFPFYIPNILHFSLEITEPPWLGLCVSQDLSPPVHRRVSHLLWAALVPGLAWAGLLSTRAWVLRGPARSDLTEKGWGQIGRGVHIVP